MAQTNMFLKVGINDYRPNYTMPSPIIEYFTSRTGNGRVMPIRCPDWIYLLPIYTGKPIIDGWYPQEKLLIPLLEINDYQINTLSSTPPEQQDTWWLNLIRNSSELGITWVMIGDASKIHLMQNSNFKLSDIIEDIFIYEAINEPSFIDLVPRNNVDNISFNRVSSEEMKIMLTDIKGNLYVTVKEAYYPGWNVYANGSRIEVVADDYGFISFSINQGKAYSIDVTYKKNILMPYHIISLITLLTLLILLLHTRIVQANYF
jgi:hypothetical protein